MQELNKNDLNENDVVSGKVETMKSLRALPNGYNADISIFT